MGRGVAELTALDRRNLGYLLARASQRWNDLLAERFAAAGYPEVRPAYGAILVPLYERDGQRMGELAAEARLSKQTMTTLIRAMEDAGLVRRDPDPDDARAARVYLAERARELRPVAESVLAELEARVGERLTPRQVSALRRSLEKLLDL